MTIAQEQKILHVVVDSINHKSLSFGLILLPADFLGESVSIVIAHPAVVTHVKLPERKEKKLVSVQLEVRRKTVLLKLSYRYQINFATNVTGNRGKISYSYNWGSKIWNQGSRKNLPESRIWIQDQKEHRIRNPDPPDCLNPCMTYLKT
jgi:hypothetical protein